MLIGIGATLLDNCEIGDDCLIAAGAVVRPGTIVPEGKMVAGVPGKILRDVTAEDRAYHLDVVTRYVALAAAHANGEFPPLPGMGG